MAGEWFAQPGSGVRFEWGPTGAAALAGASAAAVIVDVLSFSTAVTVAVEAGIAVLPYPWRDETAAAFAREHDAVLAVGRRAATEGVPWSLSPAALRRAPYTPRLVLPSPNGSSIAAASRGPVLVAGCLRNASAVAAWLVHNGFGTAQRAVTVVAAGERWPDGSLRPALEDILGAGAVIAGLRAAGATLSPEATMACHAFQASDDVPSAVANCASGMELMVGGFAEDVAIAAEMDSSAVVPVLTDGEFRG
jgi:2-phosphosulfolactate phosphatase